MNYCNNVIWGSDMIICTSKLIILYQEDNFVISDVSDFMGNRCNKDSKEWKEANLYIKQKERIEAKRLLND